MTRTEPPSIEASAVKISAIVLAGGRGSRLGGQDKGWLPHGGRPLIERVLNAIEPQVDDIVISCNRNLVRYRELGHTVVSDGDYAYDGPLAGIAAAVKLCRHDWIQLCPCDTPNLPAGLSRRLLRTAQAAEVDAAIPEDRHGSQYLCALINRRLLSVAESALKRNQLAVKSWLAVTNTIRVDFSGEDEAFLNINSPDQLRSGTPRRGSLEQ